MQYDIQKAANEGNLEKINWILSKINKFDTQEKMPDWAMMCFGGFILLVTLGVGLLAFTWTSNG